MCCDLKQCKECGSPKLQVKILSEEKTEFTCMHCFNVWNEITTEDGKGKLRYVQSIFDTMFGVKRKNSHGG